jgi:hypothetical protein
MATDPIRFTGELRVRCTPQLAKAVEKAARARGVKLSDWLRGAAETNLTIEGIEAALAQPIPNTSPEPHPS